ncbi:MAG: hypothetical protein ABIO44_01255 [Saprospiraceae bacterium]
MVDTFTLHSLVRYTYNESSADEKQQLEELCTHDFEIREEILILQEAKRMLPKVTFYPLDLTIRNILNYSLKV